MGSRQNGQDGGSLWSFAGGESWELSLQHGPQSMPLWIGKTVDREWSDWTMSHVNFRLEPAASTFIFQANAGHISKSESEYSEKTMLHCFTECRHSPLLNSFPTEDRLVLKAVSCPWKSADSPRKVSTIRPGQFGSSRDGIFVVYLIYTSNGWRPGVGIIHLKAPSTGLMAAEARTEPRNPRCLPSISASNCWRRRLLFC